MRKESFEWEDDLREQKWSMERNTLLTYQRTTTTTTTKLARRLQMSGLMFLVLGTIYTRKTRGGVVQSKRWGLLFTCLSSRAVHIELLESMDTSSFVFALRRFFAICGPAAVLRKDRRGLNLSWVAYCVGLHGMSLQLLH